MDGPHHGTTFGIETHLRVGVSDPSQRAADGFLDTVQCQHAPVIVNTYLTRNNHKPCCTKSFTCTAGVRIRLQQAVQDGIGNLVRNLVGMAHGDGFTGEKVAFAVGIGWHKTVSRYYFIDTYNKYHPRS